MTPENFCYWLQGFNELNGQTPTEDQWKSITEHLELVFKKVTPVGPGQTTLTDHMKNRPFPTLGERAICSAQPSLEPKAEITCSVQPIEVSGVLNRSQAEALSRAVSQMSLQC